MISAKEFDMKRKASGIGLRQLCREAGTKPPTYYYGLNVSGWWTRKIYQRFEDALSRLKQST